MHHRTNYIPDFEVAIYGSRKILERNTEIEFNHVEMKKKEKTERLSLVRV